MDRDKEAIRTARSRVDGTFVVAEVPPIPFSDDAFDFVVSFETVEHIRNDIEFIREVRRVLRPGGTLLMSTPNAEISAPGGVPVNQWHVREYDVASLTALLRKGGLDICELFVQSFPPAMSRGHRIAWYLNGLTWSQPAVIRAATRALLGDAQVRPRDDHQPTPGYWLASAVKGMSHD